MIEHDVGMREVAIEATPLARLAELLAPERAERLNLYMKKASSLLAGRTVWNVNTTAQGGGVAEMLQALLAYAKGAGVNTRWLVMTGDPEFFTITKRLHNMLHGSPGDGGALGALEGEHYQAVQQANLEQLRKVVAPGDIVLLHDPQTGGMVEGVRTMGAHPVWRSHIGSDDSTVITDLGWQFLRPHIESAEAFIFSRRNYAPSWVPQDKLRLIPPSLDPFTAKNAWLYDEDVAAALSVSGLVDLPQDGGSLLFSRRDGDTGTLRPHTDLVVTGNPVPGDARIVLQVSRWDRLKDMTGVLTAFADGLEQLPEDVHLLLVGPEVSSVSDDPEGAEVLAETLAVWESLAPATSARIHLACLPMDDVDENAHLVNALQRKAAVVVQKSLAEGFGLTVTEPMWKAKPVIASAVGGIRDQIVDEAHGLLLQDPRDPVAFVAALHRVLEDDALATRLGDSAKERVRDRYLGDRHLIQYVDLFETLIASPAPVERTPD